MKRGLNMVGFAWSFVKFFEILAGTQMEPLISGSNS